MIILNDCLFACPSFEISPHSRSWKPILRGVIRVNKKDNWSWLIVYADIGIFPCIKFFFNMGDNFSRIQFSDETSILPLLMTNCDCNSYCKRSVFFTFTLINIWKYNGTHFYFTYLQALVKRCFFSLKMPYQHNFRYSILHGNDKDDKYTYYILKSY